ncbi:uncharacterized protein LOC126602967 [Malus sylvestris]|uniref:uncharacterized protein LOC126602967 n=1 Tax=Malus sylvestris TaxID=3752 RepID=UPI0021ABD8D3|nr:uncharacterized protein LOC126602967 [Malus sylvestris]
MLITIRFYVLGSTTGKAAHREFSVRSRSNTTKRRHEVLTSLLSNFTNQKDKWYWISQFIPAYYTGVIVIMYEDFLIDKCGWVNWYLVGQYVKKDFYALELFEKMSEKGSEDKMEISHWRALYSFENTNYIWNPSGCTIIVEVLVSKFQGISATFHQYATSKPPIAFDIPWKPTPNYNYKWNELSQFQNVEFDHVAKAIENVGVRWIVLPTTSILFLLVAEKSKRQRNWKIKVYLREILIENGQDNRNDSLPINIECNAASLDGLVGVDHSSSKCDQCAFRIISTYCFSRRHGKAVRCMGKVWVRETDASSSRSTTGHVIALTEEVATLKDQLVAHDEKMNMILWALQMSGLQMSMLALDLAPPSTSQPLRPADTQ